MTDYKISHSAGTCCLSGRSFAEGEIFYTVIVDNEDGFQRLDYSQEAWTAPPPDALCHFKTRMPKHDAPAKTFVNDDVLIHFFLRLGESDKQLKLRFRFVLSLILLRKRLLKYEKTIHDETGEYWLMRLRRDKSEHRVFNPELNESQIEEVSGELNIILHGHVPEDPVDPEESETHEPEMSLPKPPDTAERSDQGDASEIQCEDSVN